MSLFITNFPDDYAGHLERLQEGRDCDCDLIEGCPKCDRQMAEDERAERIGDRMREEDV